MVVNPFWFGCLCTLSVEMAILIVVAAINFHVYDEDDDDEKSS